MQDEVSHRTRRIQREPVFQGKRRIPGLYSYLAADGTLSYPWSRRVDGKMRRGVLETTGRVGQERKTDAINEYHGLFADIQRGDVELGDRSVTVAALAASYLEREEGVLGTRAARTLELHRQRLNDHVIPALGGNTKAADVRVQQLRKMIDTLKTKKTNDGKRRLSGSTIRGCISATSAMFRHGVRNVGCVPRNPVRDLDRGDLPSRKRRSKPRYLTVGQVESIFAEMTDVFRPVAATCFWTGMRISETLALRWRDIDFDAGAIDVPGTKTEGAEAPVPLLPALVRELRAHRERQATRGFDRIRSDALVFQTSSGKSPGRRNALRALQTAAVNAELVAEGQEPVGLHDLRHSLAANSFALGLTDVEVSRLLRHANPRVTLTVYADLVEGEMSTKLGQKLAAEGFGS
jgi:integrase